MSCVVIAASAAGPSVAAGPAASSPWSASTTLPGATDGHLPQIVFASGGVGAVLWSGPPAKYDSASWIGLAADQPSGAPSPVAGSTLFATQASGFAAAGAGNSVIVTGNTADAAGNSHASVLTGSLAGPVGAPVQLSSRLGLAMPVAANGKGRYALLVGTGSGLALITGRIGDRARRTVSLSHAVVDLADVAIDKHGDALAVWSEGKKVFARIESVTGRLTSKRRLGSLNAGSVHAALADSGQAVVAWGGEDDIYYQSCDCSKVVGPATFSAALGRVSGRFKPVIRLASFADPKGTISRDEGSDLTSRRAMSLVLVGRGQHPVVGWRQLVNGVSVARIATGATFQTRHDISITGLDTQLDGLVAGPNGELLALLTTVTGAAGSNPLAGLVSECAAAGVSFGPPETMPSTLGKVTEPAAAFDPSTGVAVAAWTDAALHGAMVVAHRAAGC